MATDQYRVLTLTPGMLTDLIGAAAANMQVVGWHMQHTESAGDLLVCELGALNPARPEPDILAFWCADDTLPDGIVPRYRIMASGRIVDIKREATVKQP